MKAKNNCHLLSFVFPIVILGTVFALHGVYPFGSRQILVGDFWQQYYPFLSNFWHEVRAGTVSPWSWTAGAGHDYTALLAYYMASPLNLIAVILPHAWLREVLSLLMLVKIGLAGLFMSFYLRYAFHREAVHTQQSAMALPFFSSLYALCAFLLGYYCNIIWIDGFALLPLVILGVLALMREGKYRLYVISLGLAVLVNFHIGYFICIFTAITFIGQCIMQKPDKKMFLHKLLLIIACSGLALGLAAIFLTPAWSAIQNTNTAEMGLPAYIGNYFSYSSILGNFIAFTPPTVTNGLPNLYSGMISILLAGLFIRSKKIPVREKLIFSGTIIILLLSCNLNILDFFWNGFRFTNQLPFRFSFLLSFTLTAAAYHVFIVTDDINRRDVPAMCVAAALILLAAFIGPQKTVFIICSAVLGGVYILLLFFKDKGSDRIRPLIMASFFLLIITELSISAYMGVKANGTSSREEYPDKYDQIQELLGMRQPSGSNFYRTEFTGYYSMNDTSLYNTRGISFFSSTANSKTIRFMQGLGLTAREGLTYLYTETSPLTNAFLNIRYLISRDGGSNENGIYWEPVGTAGNATLMENKRYLPLGFMVNEDIINYIPVDNDPFLSQNNLFRLATGLDADLFTVTKMGEHTYFITGEEGDELVFLGWEYEALSDSMLYAYYLREKTEIIFFIYNDNERKIELTRPRIFTIGPYSPGNIITILANNAVPFGENIVLEKEEIVARDSMFNSAVFHIGSLDAEVFDRGYTLLASEPLQLTEFSGTRIRGHITASKDGLLYTSIPGDNNWTAYVNGERSEIIKIGGSMIALRLRSGTHTIEFRYFNRSLLAGILISIASLVIYTAMIILDMRKRRKREV